MLWEVLSKRDVRRGFRKEAIESIGNTCAAYPTLRKPVPPSRTGELVSYAMGECGDGEREGAHQWACPPLLRLQFNTRHRKQGPKQEAARRKGERRCRGDGEAGMAGGALVEVKSRSSPDAARSGDLSFSNITTTWLFNYMVN